MLRIIKIKVMKKKLFKILPLLFLSLSLASCGGGGAEEAEIKLPEPPKDIKYAAVKEVEGPLADYIEIVEGDYAFNIEKSNPDYGVGYDGTLKIKVKFLSTIDVKQGTGYNSYGPTLNGEIIDASGAKLEFNLDISTDADFARYLKRGSGEEWLTLNLSGQGSIDSEEDAVKMLEKFKKGKKIRFISEIVEEKFDDEEEESSASTEESSSEDSGDCGEFLSEYEDFMDNYIDILDKYKEDPTDMSILSEYSSITQEAQEWTSKISDCASDPLFAAKFAKIQMKIASAASN